MRDIEFLPEWYPAIQRRYRWVAVQAWVTVAVVLLIAGYAVARRVAVRSANQTAAATQAQINLSRQQLVQLSEKLKFEDELRQQERIVGRLGLGVETTRLLKALEEAMTPEMALTNLSLETQEQPRVITAIAQRSGAANQPVEMDRRLKVVVDGVAPTEIEAVTMMGNLLKVSCFENVAIQMNEGKMRDGHIARQFEVTFEMNLNPPAEGRP
jgi:hypothetical protein